MSNEPIARNSRQIELAHVMLQSAHFGVFKPWLRLSDFKKGGGPQIKVIFYHVTQLCRYNENNMLP